MKAFLALSTLCVVAACERAPNYNAGIPGGRSTPVDPDAGKPAAPPPAAPETAAAANTRTAAPSVPAAPATPAVNEQPAASGGGLAAPPKQYDTPEGEAAPAAPASEVVAPPTNSPDAPPPPSIDRVRQHAASKRFDEIRGMSKRYRELQRELRVLSERLSQGVTDADRARYLRLEKEAEAEWPRLRAYMWNERWSEFDRAAMGLIIYGEGQ